MEEDLPAVLLEPYPKVFTTVLRFATCQNRTDIPAFLLTSVAMQGSVHEMNAYIMQPLSSSYLYHEFSSESIHQSSCTTMQDLPLSWLLDLYQKTFLNYASLILVLGASQRLCLRLAMSESPKAWPRTTNSTYCGAPGPLRLTSYRPRTDLVH